MKKLKVQSPKRLKRSVWSFFTFIALSTYPLSSQPSDLQKYHQIAMGTIVEITLLSNDEEAARRAVLQAFQEIKRIEQLMSPRIESSDLARVNQSAGKEWVKVSPETYQVIQKAQEISRLSEGGFDITIGPLTQLWRKAREKGIPPPTEDINKILDLVSFRNILIHPEGNILLKKKGMVIDLGGIAKGYAVDRAFETLTSLGYNNLIVNAGGDLRVGGSKNNQPWSIGIQDPRMPQKIMATISTSDAAIATSGDYERFFLYQGKRYHHMLHPKTGLPTEECQSVTIICEEGAMADGLATAVFVLGPEKGYALCKKLEGVDCLIVGRDKKIVLSPSLKDRISSSP
jgi:thiamine biosynthesis lipoprotein